MNMKDRAKQKKSHKYVFLPGASSGDKIGLSNFSDSTVCTQRQKAEAKTTNHIDQK